MREASSSLLETINDPKDLNKLTAAELVYLAQEIRSKLINSVAKTGGHLGPNLGVVELSIALHRVFDSPNDLLIWDTGHQAYVHKMLTGRQDFSHLRQCGGLSGYPSRAESEHDVVENSHASTSLSWADGISLEQQRQGKKNTVVAIIGDGALTGGMAWEALNNIAERQDRSLVVVVNDNGRSYEPTIGGMAHHLAGLRTSEGYEKTTAWAKRTLLSMGDPGKAAYEALHAVKTGLKDIVVPQVLFEDLGLKYLGPVDGHDSMALEYTLERAKEYGRPVIVHVITEKGRGYSPAEEHISDRFHAVGKIHPETGLPVVPDRFGWTAAFAEKLLDIGKKNPNVVALTAAMKEPVGLKPFARQYPNRVYDVGIAEQHAVTAAAGMAFAGAHPVFAVYASFLNRGFDQLLMDTALHKAPVTFVLDRAGVTGDDGASHNGMWDLSLATMIPGLKTAVPRDGATLGKALEEAVQYQDGPTLIRYPKGELPPELAVVESEKEFDFLVKSPGSSTAILVFGSLANVAVEAALLAKDEDIPVDVISPTWVLPVEPNLLKTLANYDHVLCVEDGLENGGLGAEVLLQASKMGIATQFQVRGVPKQFLAQNKREQILEDLGLSVSEMLKFVRRSQNIK